MKAKEIFGSVCFLALAASLTACSSDDNNEPSINKPTSYTKGVDGGLTSCNGILFNEDGTDNANGTQIGNGEQGFVFTGNTTLKKGTYTLKGWVYIANGATLTIEPGTVIKGDKETKAALIAEPGGKLIARGTQQQPIVFTSEQAPGSRKPGDWGGVILCGKAPNNNGVLAQQIEGGPRTKHGGNDPKDNSGVLEYVRIEFAGYPFEKDKEINGLTLGSVGSGTTIDHVQVSYSNDDSYEWFGGTVNCKYLVAFRGWDDDFDTDNGFAGNVQYGLSVRDSKIADASQSNGFESDNNAGGTTAEPYTTATFSNMTFLGPKTFDANFQNTTDYINGGGMNPENGSSMGKFQAAMHIRRNSRLNCYNSVAIGWPVGLILDNEKGNTQEAATNGLLKLHRIAFAGMDAVGTDFNKIYQDNLYDYTTKTLDVTKPSFSSTFFKNPANGNIVLDWTATAYNGIASVIAASTQVGSSLTASFDELSGNSWFDKVNFVGAFQSGNDWTAGWTNFDPENTVY